MANSQCVTTTFKVDLLNAKHNFGTTVVRTTTTTDSFKMSLYVTTATIDSTTPAYTVTGEVAGAGYTAGGQSVSFGSGPASSGTTAFTTPSTNVVFSVVTLATAFDCAMMYNNTLTGKNSCTVHTFNPTTVTASDFTLSMPTNDSSSALIRLS